MADAKAERRPLRFVAILPRSRAAASPGKRALNEAGVTAIEYALIGGLVAIVIVGAVTALGTSVSSLFGAVLDGL